MTLDYLPPVPSVKEYVKAFHEIKNEITPKQMRLLRSLYTAPNYSRTTSELAAFAGYKNYRGTNLQIGLMGGLLRDALKYHDSSGQQSYSLCYFTYPETDPSDWIFTLHEEVVAALTELAWFH